MLAADLFARNVDVIVNEGGATSVLAAKNATTTVPIFFHTSTDPVADGLVTSLSRPGGNLTGIELRSVAMRELNLSKNSRNQAHRTA